MSIVKSARESYVEPGTPQCVSCTTDSSSSSYKKPESLAGRKHCWCYLCGQPFSWQTIFGTDSMEAISTRLNEIDTAFQEEGAKIGTSVNVASGFFWKSKHFHSGVSIQHMKNEYEYAHNAYLEKQVYTCQDCLGELRKIRKTVVYKFIDESRKPKLLFDKKNKLFHYDYICVPCWRKDTREHKFLWKEALRDGRARDLSQLSNAHGLMCSLCYGADNGDTNDEDYLQRKRLNVLYMQPIPKDESFAFVVPEKCKIKLLYAENAISGTEQLQGPVSVTQSGGTDLENFLVDRSIRGWRLPKRLVLSDRNGCRFRDPDRYDGVGRRKRGSATTFKVLNAGDEFFVQHGSIIVGARLEDGQHESQLVHTVNPPRDYAGNSIVWVRLPSQMGILVDPDNLRLDVDVDKNNNVVAQAWTNTGMTRKEVRTTVMNGQYLVRRVNYRFRASSGGDTGARFILFHYEGGWMTTRPGYEISFANPGASRTSVPRTWLSGNVMTSMEHISQVDKDYFNSEYRSKAQAERDETLTFKDMHGTPSMKWGARNLFSNAMWNSMILFKKSALPPRESQSIYAAVEKQKIPNFDVYIKIPCFRADQPLLRSVYYTNCYAEVVVGSWFQSTSSTSAKKKQIKLQNMYSGDNRIFHDLSDHRGESIITSHFGYLEDVDRERQHKSRRDYRASQMRSQRQNIAQQMVRYEETELRHRVERLNNALASDKVPEDKKALLRAAKKDAVQELKSVGAKMYVHEDRVLPSNSEFKVGDEIYLRRKDGSWRDGTFFVVSVQKDKTYVVRPQSGSTEVAHQDDMWFEKTVVDDSGGESEDDIEVVVQHNLLDIGAGVDVRGGALLQCSLEEDCTSLTEKRRLETAIKRLREDLAAASASRKQEIQEQIDNALRRLEEERNIKYHRCSGDNPFAISSTTRFCFGVPNGRDGNPMVLTSRCYGSPWDAKAPENGWYNVYLTSRDKWFDMCPYCYDSMINLAEGIPNAFKKGDYIYDSSGRILQQSTGNSLDPWTDVRSSEALLLPGLEEDMKGEPLALQIAAVQEKILAVSADADEVNTELKESDDVVEGEETEDDFDFDASDMEDLEKSSEDEQEL